MNEKMAKTLPMKNKPSACATPRTVYIPICGVSAHAPVTNRDQNIRRSLEDDQTDCREIRFRDIAIRR